MKNNDFLSRLADISPQNLTDYLEKNGWIRDGVLGHKAIVWHRGEEQNFEYEVIQPTDTSVKGFAQRHKEAIDSIAEFENQNLNHILDNISNFSADLVKIRVIHNDVYGGSIPLDDGVLLVEKSRELLVASTLATFSKRKYFTGGRPAEVQEFLSSLRLGQTEVGSFIVNLISPITSSSEDQGTLVKTSLTRSVMNNLGNSLNAISLAIVQYSDDQDIFHFEEVVNRGVSANLCDALIGLSGSGKSRSFEINIKLAGIEVDDQNIEDYHLFKPEQLPAIERASEYFKGNYVINDYSAFGLVTKMKHITGEDLYEISINSRVNFKNKNITVQVQMEDYWKAVHAHESESYVSCSGSLIVTPKTATLIDPVDFNVSVNGELF